MGRKAGTVVRLTHPAVLHIREINKLWQQAFSSPAALTPWGPQLELELAQRLASPYVGAFVGEEDSEYRAAALIFLPTDAMLPVPTWYLLYNAGTRTLSKQIVNAGVEFIVAAGHNTCWAVNRIADDRAYARLFEHAGAMKTVGTLVEFST